MRPTPILFLFYDKMHSVIQPLNVQKIGERTINTVAHFTAPYRLGYNALTHTASLKVTPVRTILYKQIYFTGIEALKTVSIIAGLIGIVIITQTASIAGLNSALVGKILIWTVVRELGPLLTAIIIIARSGSAIAAELGFMKVNGEIDSLKVMGISPLNYLIVPRVIGITVSVLILSVYFQIFSIMGGLFLSSLFTGTSFYQYARTIFSALNLFEVSISLLKSLVFGLIISAVSCYQGLRVKSAITEVPQATTVAVMQSLFSVFIFDGLITLISFL